MTTANDVAACLNRIAEMREQLRQLANVLKSEEDNLVMMKCKYLYNHFELRVNDIVEHIVPGVGIGRVVIVEVKDLVMEHRKERLYLSCKRIKDDGRTLEGSTYSLLADELKKVGVYDPKARQAVYY